MNRYIETLLSITILSMGLIIEYGLLMGYLSLNTGTPSILNSDFLSEYSNIQTKYLGLDIKQCILVKNSSEYLIYVCGDVVHNHTDGYIYPVYLGGGLGVVVCIRKGV